MNCKKCKWANVSSGDTVLLMNNGMVISQHGKNPEIYCSDDGFATSMPKSIPEESSSYYWYRCLSKEWKYD